MRALIDAEEWVDIKGYEDSYQVSSHGRVRSKDRAHILRGRHPEPHLRVRKGKLMKLSGEPYLAVSISKDGKKDRFLVHRLVAENFIDNPEELPEVNHLDEDKKNNRPSNLEWTTRSGNALHSSYKNRGNLSGTSKLKEDEVLKIKERLLKGESQTEIAREFGVSNHCIFRIQAGYNWSWLTGLGKEGNGTCAL